MKFICFLIFLLNLISIIFSKIKRSKTNALSKVKTKSKNRKGIFFSRSPYYGRVYSNYYGPSRLYYQRPLVISTNLLVPLSQYNECPDKKGKKILIGKSSGSCKLPCNIKTCIQIALECCTYGFPEKK